MKYYNIDKLLEENAMISLCYGERSNGKSYQGKIKIMFSDDVLNGLEEFILCRRIAEEIKPMKVQLYFQDMPIEVLTKGKADGIELYRNEIWLTKFNAEKAKRKRIQKIGYTVALNTAHNFTGAEFPKVKWIIFEEYMSRTSYLSEEPTRLMDLFCTVDRKRGTTRILMIGNTISRVCPYYSEWGLWNIIKKQKQGEILSVEKDVSIEQDGSLIRKIAMEHCEETKQTSYTFGKHTEMLNKGSWQVDEQPTLPHGFYNESEILFRSVFIYSQFQFLASFCMHDGYPFWFIAPKTSEIKPNTHIFTDLPYVSKYVHLSPYCITDLGYKQVEIFRYFTEDYIFYADYQTGTDFKQCINFSIKKGGVLK